MKKYSTQERIERVRKAMSDQPGISSRALGRLLNIPDRTVSRDMRVIKGAPVTVPFSQFMQTHSQTGHVLKILANIGDDVKPDDILRREAGIGERVWRRLINSPELRPFRADLGVGRYWMSPANVRKLRQNMPECFKR